MDSFVKMTSLGFKPDWYSIGSLLLACTELKLLQYAKEAHGFVIRNGVRNRFTYRQFNTFILHSM
ncbi:hypothetical protein HanIR_Chr05g0242931 [Helianthus annuus]|nr:hypothetical protein HanIR_Chr05g0242931 [Helianthus annuus]